MFEPFKWIGLALRDMRRAPLASLFYGAAFAAMGFALQRLFSYAPQHTISLITGFMLLGPFLSIGLYEVSRRLEEGETRIFIPTLTAWRANVSGIGLFSMILALTFAGWMRVSVVLFALFYTDEISDLDTMFRTTFFTVENIPFLVMYFGTGFLFAILVFAISVVSIPMLLERDGDTIGAMITSVRALTINPLAMSVWGLLIVMLCAMGFATHFAGLIVTIPLVAHASWHAYRDIVDKTH